MKLTSAYLGHHGLVAGIYDELGIGNIIDKTLPKQGQHKLSHSVIVKASSSIHLGSTRDGCIYSRNFFKNPDTERLLGAGVVPDDINDDVLERTLDKIYDNDPTELFLKIVLNVMEKVPFGTRFLHADTTSVSVHGDYEHIDGSRAIEITYGHTKDNRPDLKQFIVSMITNQHGIPLFAKTYSGNKSDKKSIIESIERMRAGIVPSIIMISNCAGTSIPIRDCTITRWPELEIGSHSVNPWRRPRMSAWLIVSSCIRVIRWVKTLFMHSVFERNEKEENIPVIRKIFFFYQEVMGIFWSPGISTIRV